MNLHQMTRLRFLHHLPGTPQAIEGHNESKEERMREWPFVDEISPVCLLVPWLAILFQPMTSFSSTGGGSVVGPI